MFHADRKRGLIPALLLGTAFAAVGIAPAFADDQVETVVVTGSLLHRTDTETPSPVQVISRAAIQNSGNTSVSDVIRSISADSSGTIPTAFGNGFAAGSSGVALRGLTVNSTLVLINGRRTANYPLADDGERGFVDLNTIPLDVVDHIEILKDGASSVYGADAIGGVVNIILRDSYQGMEATAEAGTSEAGGGFMKRFTGTFGFGDMATDRFNGYVNVEYQDDQHIRVSDRDFPFNTNDLTSIGGLDLRGSTSIYGKATPTMETRPGDVTSGGPALGPSIVLADSGCGPLGTPSTNAGGAYCAQSFSPYGDDQPKEERYGIYGHVAFQANADTEAYLDWSYFQNNVGVDAPPPSIRAGSPHNTTSIVLPALLPTGAVNPNDPFAVAGCIEGVTCQDAAIFYRFGDITGGTSTYNNHVLRATMGLKGTFDGWSYDTAVVAAHSWLNSDLHHQFVSYNALINDVVNGIYNFRDPSQNTQEIRNTLSPDLTKTSTTDMDSIDMRASHDLFTLPGGTSQIGFGAEIRHEATYDPDLNPNADTENLGLAHTIGNRNIYSVSAELGLPILHTLEGDISARYDHYTDFGDTFNPKVGLKWTPIPEVALRGTWSRGFRAPSFSENGSAESEGFTVTAPPAAFIAAHGGGDDYTIPYAIGFDTTANSRIRPETSTSFTGGAVIQPFADYNFSATIDYYYIQKKNVISPADPSAALDAAFAGQPIPAGYNVIFDNPDPLHPTALLRPLIVQAPYINANSLSTNGLDIEIQGGTDLAWGLNWNTDFQMTRIFTYRFSPAPGTTYEYVGTESPYITSSGAGMPRTRFTWSNSFTLDALTVTGTLYFTSGLQQRFLDQCGLPAYGNDCVYGVTLKGVGDDFWDFDLTGRYQLTDTVQVYAGIKNLFDADPPITPADYAGVNYNPTYNQAGIIGRFYQFGVTLKE
jgi:iron complex outermembrane receptor protein